MHECVCVSVWAERIYYYFLSGTQPKFNHSRLLRINLVQISRSWPTCTKWEGRKRDRVKNQRWPNGWLHVKKRKDVNSSREMELLESHREKYKMMYLEQRRRRRKRQWQQPKYMYRWKLDIILCAASRQDQLGNTCRHRTHIDALAQSIAV